MTKVKMRQSHAAIPLAATFLKNDEVEGKSGIDWTAVIWDRFDGYAYVSASSRRLRAMTSLRRLAGPQQELTSKVVTR